MNILIDDYFMYKIVLLKTFPTNKLQPWLKYYQFHMSARLCTHSHLCVYINTGKIIYKTDNTFKSKQ